MNKRFALIGAFILMIGAMVLMIASAQDGAEGVDERYVGRVPAPQFPSDLDWLNVENPLTIEGLQGKIVILDFWTYGCINCIHMIPVLEELEQKYADEIVVIGVHSAKFDNEGETDNIRQIVQRYDLQHPVINDRAFSVWRSYSVQAWPSFGIIDPRGNIVALQAGEIPFEAFDQYIGSMIAYYDGLGTEEINREPLALALEGAGDPGTPLLYPSKVLVDAQGERLFITDSNHHRIVIADLNTYEVLATIGNGRRGFEDGDYASATFFQPHGITLDHENQTLYIADTNNHAIRAVDLQREQVRTVAGTGEMGRSIVPFGVEVDNPLTFDLRSPWDVELDDAGRLHIAMAGTHQLWLMDIRANTLRPSVGNGREAQLSTTLADSELAQPSGLHYLDGLLYFADSESSTVRVADFNTDTVRVIAGTTNNDLFDYGDIDGAPGTSRLQHALGVTASPDGERVYIADTYNSRIKLYTPADDTVTTLFGLGGDGGFADGNAETAQFDEPGGLTYYDEKLYIADTNNHAIRVVNLSSGDVNTITFPNPEDLIIDPDTLTIIGGNSASPDAETLEAINIAEGAGTIALNIAIPEGYKLNPLIESSATLQGDNIAWAETDNLTIGITRTDPSLAVTFTSGTGDATLTLTVYYCEAEQEAFCLIDEVTYTLPLSVADDVENAPITIERIIVPPDVYNTGL